MNRLNTSPTSSLQTSLVYFIAAAPFVNLVALFGNNESPLFYVAQALAFIYILVTPGLFFLPLITPKKFPFALGITLGVAVSLFALMLLGLGLNTFLPLAGITAPLTTIPLLLAFDVFIFTLFIFNAVLRKPSAIEIPPSNRPSRMIVAISLLLPILAVLGAISLNDGGTDLFTMAALALIFVLTLVMVLYKNRLDGSVAPITLFMMALALLLMNSMRGWLVTGHDILLEYHVFAVTNDAHFWNMAAYRDPYNACLSITILPAYLQNLLHVDGGYIFKLLLQFMGALPVVMVYYLGKQYVSNVKAFLVGLVYISFPSFMVDMSFLNRQGIAFLFFGAMIFTLLTTEYFTGRTRHAMLFLFGTGMVLSHYSTSYVAIGLLVGGYIVSKILRFIVGPHRPRRFFKKLPTAEMYQRPILLTLPFVIGLIAIVVLWSTFVTKTSDNMVTTLKQIATTVAHPFNIDESSGAAKYSLVQSQTQTPQQMFDQFVERSTSQARTSSTESNLFPLSVVGSYPQFPVSEPLLPLTPAGESIQSTFHFGLPDFFNGTKQAYAKAVQALLLLGLVGLGLGYGFKKNLLENVPAEYIALSITGVGLMAGQTLLPGGAIDYGLFRLFQQNLTFLALPMALGLIGLIGLVARNRTAQMFISSGILLGFFLILSGFVPQITGGGRAALALNNSGFYYDAYYTHAQEILPVEWLALNDSQSLIQADHYFSTIKMLAYAKIAPLPGLLAQTIQKNSYVYLNYNNVKSSDVIEFVNGDVFYYHFPIDFLGANKNLIYNDGGSEIYR